MNSILKCQQTYQVEIRNRDDIIGNLKTRLNDVESKSTLNFIQLEKLKVEVDNNEQYSRKLLYVYGD